jgi:PAS domain S-box-containing protein
MQSLTDLFSLNDLIPHGYWLSWSPILRWLHVISDLLIALACYSISLMLVYFIRQRKDVPYSWLVGMVAGFIVAYGTMHLLAVITIWIPLSWLDGLLKGFTAAFSVATAVLMLRIIPQALSLPRSAQLQAEIQQRKIAEEALRVANVALQKNIAQTQLFLNSALDGIVSMDQNGKVIGWNSQAEHIFGYSSEQVLGRDLADLIVPPAYREQHRQGLSRFLTMGDSNIIGTRLEITGLHADASEFPIELTVSAWGQKDDHSFSAYVRDITERKQMEEKLRDSDAFNVSVLNSLTSQIAVLNAKGVIVAVNSAWRRFAEENGLSSTGQVMLGGNYLDACQNACGEGESPSQAGIMAVLSGELETFHLEYPCHSRSQPRWFHMTVLPLQGSRHGVVVSHKNITERKQAEETAQAAAQYARSLIEASLDPLVTISAEGKVTDVNTATEQVTGVSRDNLIGSDFAAYFTNPERARAGYQQVFSQGLVTDYPLAIRHVSGKITEVLYNASLYRDGNGNVLGVFAAARDITERKRIEAELIRSNAELEQFAYAVSHDMRQPLRMVSSYLSLIENALSGQLDEETQQFIDFAVNGAQRMDAMILSLLDYSRVGRKFEAKTLLSSKESLDEALAFLNPELTASGGEITVTGDWPELVASGDELTRLLQNLIGNALKYHEDHQAPQVHVHGAICAGSLRVEVRDHGIGIEPGQMHRLFKVFSRLQVRSRFDGTGVGLALCRKIVEHHGGTIGAESAGEGQGSMFWFELPVVNAVNPE